MKSSKHLHHCKKLHHPSKLPQSPKLCGTSKRLAFQILPKSAWYLRNPGRPRFARFLTRKWRHFLNSEVFSLEVSAALPPIIRISGPYEVSETCSFTLDPCSKLHAKISFVGGMRYVLFFIHFRFEVFVAAIKIRMHQ